MQNAGMRHLGLPWRYAAFDVRPEDLRQALEGATAMRFAGINLTVPHKLLAMDMVDVLDETAREWGAVNTVVFEGRDENGVWRPLGLMEPGSTRDVRRVGHNTDADAIERAIREAFALRCLEGLSVLLLGAGGAARAAALRLARERLASIHLINRTREKAETLAAEIRERHPETEVRTDYPSGSVDLLINGTSLGLKEADGLPFDGGCFELRRAVRVYDMMYRPPETRLLREAKLAGCEVSNGLGMLLYQGARALELWTGRTAPVDVMGEALRRAVLPAGKALAP